MTTGKTLFLGCLTLIAILIKQEKAWQDLGIFVYALIVNVSIEACTSFSTTIYLRQNAKCLIHVFFTEIIIYN